MRTMKSGLSVSAPRSGTSENMLLKERPINGWEVD
jgi:hypothetical protein